MTAVALDNVDPFTAALGAGRGRLLSNGLERFLAQPHDQTFAAALAQVAGAGQMDLDDETALARFAARRFAADHPRAYNGEPFAAALKPRASTDDKPTSNVTADAEAVLFTRAIATGAQELPGNAALAYDAAITAAVGHYYTQVLRAITSPDVWLRLLGRQRAESLRQRAAALTPGLALHTVVDERRLSQHITIALHCGADLEARGVLFDAFELSLAERES